MGYFLLTKFILLLMLKTYRTIKMKKSVISFVFLFQQPCFDEFFAHLLQCVQFYHVSGVGLCNIIGRPAAFL